MDNFFRIYTNNKNERIIDYDLRASERVRWILNLIMMLTIAIAIYYY